MLRNDQDRYGLIAKLLHWSIAVGIISLIALGWWMVGLSYYDRWYNRALEWHKSIGMLVLAAAACKLLWLAISPEPQPLAALAVWQRRAAVAMHWLLFSMMFLIPVTGYIISTSAGQDVPVFGWVKVPALLAKNDRIRDLAIELHYWLAYTTAALVVLHAVAALKHQFIDRDGTLSRML